jgi:Spy/CpxP family protein refolding chaperone
MRSTMPRSLRLATAVGTALLLSGCAMPASTQSASSQSAGGNHWQAPETGSLIGGVDGGAGDNTTDPGLGFRDKVSSTSSSGGR